MALTKQDLEAIERVVASKTLPLLQEMQADFAVVRHDIDRLHDEIRSLREQIQELAVTLDRFVKSMSDYGEEFAILKAELDQVKRVIKERLGIEIAVQK